MSRYGMVSIGLALVVTGCAYKGPAVPLHGSTSELALLHGEWTGTYSGNETGRVGSILFRIEADSTQARGDVLMIPQPPQAARTGSQPAAPEPLAITFVHVAAGRITGRLDTYRDPACGCTVVTTFHGVVRDATIEGTFITEHMQTGVQHSGHWRVGRAPGSR
jgi:hypothetical protein